MESWLRLSREQTRLKIARQKRRRTLFWSVGLILVVIQVAIAVLASWPDPTETAPSSAPGWVTSAEGGTPAVATSQVHIVQTTAHTIVPAVPATTWPATALPIAWPSADALPDPSSIETRMTSTPLPPVTRMVAQTHTPPVPAASAQPAGASELVQTARTSSGTFLTTGRGTHRETPAPTRTSSSLVLLAPPEQVTEQTFELSGTGRPGDQVSILYNHSIIAQAQIDQHGDWQAEISTAPLVRGNNVFVLTTSGPDVSVPESAAAGSEDDQHVSFSTTFAPWWLDAPLRLQASLGEGYACAPTVLGVAMDYYHQLDDAYPAPATVELVRALTSRGFVSGYGADAEMVYDLAITYGYSHSFFYQEWSQAHLRQMLDAGHPVIANVRVGLSTDGYGHSVLVIGLSHDGQRVMLIDPARGMVETLWAQFDRSWASFGPPYRHGTVVMP